jgi:hypothetical protein
MSNRKMTMSLLFLVLLAAGCANRNTANDLAMVREILELAQHDKVQGSLKVHLNGQLEAGIKEGVYFGSPGTVVQADLAFRIKDVQPAKGSSGAKDDATYKVEDMSHK